MAARKPMTPSAKEAQRKGQVSSKRRQNWEKTEAGQTRMRDIKDITTEQHNALAAKYGDMLTPIRSTRMSHAQIYEARGFTERPVGPSVHDQQLPGMENPDAMPQPKRWEEYPPEKQADIARRVKAKGGVTLDSMTRSFGAQLDQGYHRAQQHNSEPVSRDFYTEGEPAQVLRRTAKAEDVPLGLVIATNADTSPQMKFRHHGKDGTIQYPNNDAAVHAIRNAKAGNPPEHVEKKEGLERMARGVLPANHLKAAKRADDVINKGIPVGDTDAGGPKTAPYHNSWLSDTPDFFVADVHSGGGGMAPHLSAEKPARVDETGEVIRNKAGLPKRHKSEREALVEVGNGQYHAMADYAARQAMAQRGLSRVRQAQAVQWGEEQFNRRETDKDPRAAARFESPEKVYSHNIGRQFQEVHPEQQKLF